MVTLNKTKRFLSVLLAFIMFSTAFPTSITTLAADVATVSVESINAVPGSTIDVNINLDNNTGIMAAAFTITYDEGLNLIVAESGEAFSALSMTKPENFNSPCKFAWDALDLADEDIKNGIILKLTFTVDEEVEPNSKLDIQVSYSTKDVIDSDLQPVPLNVNNGVVTIIDYVPGDLNSDNLVDLKDVTFIRRFITGYDVDVNELAADVNGDGDVTMMDVVLIRRYIVDAEGYGVTLVPGNSNIHIHSMTAVEEKAATCTEDGNIAYWYCTSCDKYFTDEKGTIEVSRNDTIIKSPGHTVVVDQAVEATYDSTGLTEGSHCSVCNTVLKAQDVIPKLQRTEYAIVYNISNNDTYLETLEIENPNPSTYTKEDGLNLRNLNVSGYIFEGWYDGMGSNAEQIKTIPAGTTGVVDLYAKWTPINYNISFDNTGLFTVPSETYQINQDKILPSPKLSGYVFVGWSDSDGNILSTIPSGSSYGHKTYTANWISERNKAETFKSVQAPTVYEDEERILFTYYIGKINNVPVSVINDFGYINEDGVSKTVTKTFSETFDSTQMQTLTNTVKKETTSSFGWTLSDSWNEGTTIDEGWLQTTGKTREEVEETSRNESNNWFVSSGSSGSSTISSMNSSDSFNNNASEYNVNTRNKNQIKTDDTVSASLKSTVSAEIGAGYGPISAKVGTSIESGTSAVSNVKTDRLSDVKTNNTVSNNNGTASHAETSASSTSSWNSESGRGGSSSTTQSNRVSESISTQLSKNYNLSTSYLKSNTQQETQGHEDSSSNQDEYSSAVTYSTITGKETTETYTTTNTKTGYHRWILAGTAHVFGQVGYDIASGSYFVTTFTMMDDETHQFEDYSYKSADYNDFENTVITFEAPNEIAEYVNNRVCESEGLEISKAGIVTKYTGTDKNVIIPEYRVFNNNDGTNSVVKVTGIDANVFKGNNNIETVELSNFIEEIPANAFENCTSLTHVNALGATKIGDSAFAGCTSIEELQVCEQIVSLGENVVSNETRLYVEASNKSVIEAAVKSNAKVIAISILDMCDDFEDTTLNVPSTTEKLLINGFGKTFNNVKINSNAQKTILNRVNFNSTGTVPLIISSENVELHEVSVSSPCIGIALTNGLTNLSLRGNCYINSNNENSVLCKNISTKQLDSSITTNLQVSGNILSCGGISENISLISYNDNEIITIDQETFDKYLAGQFNVTFDAGEGTVEEISRKMFYGDEIGELPIPTRDYYRFDGWYTESGEKITKTTTFSTVDDVTLVARWTENTLSGWVLASELPENATVENTKYTYTLRSYKTSGSSSMSGWTKYDTKVTSYGAKQGPVYSNPSGNNRKVTSEQYVKSTTTHYKYYHRWNGRGTWGSDSTAKSWVRHSIDLTYSLSNSGVSSSAGITWKGSYKCPQCGAQRMWIADGTYKTDNYATRWYYQEPVYTYYYYKDEDKESTTDPTGQSDVSNIQEWIQYRVK